MRQWVNSARHALRGIMLFFRTERNARIEGVIALAVIGVSCWLDLTAIEWCLILFVTGGVLAAEAFNSVVERLSDLHSTERRRDIGDIKDMSAGAVLIMATVAFITGLFIFGRRLWDMLFM